MQKQNIRLHTKGTLIAVSYDEAGNKTDSCTLVSAGDNTKLTLRPDKTEMKADNEDMVFVDVSLTDNMGIVKIWRIKTLQCR